MTTINSNTNVFYTLLSDVGKALWDSLSDPSNWKFGESGTKYTILHKKSGISLWICNGRFFLDGYEAFQLSGTKPPLVRLGLFERHILWCRVSKVVKALNNAENKAKNGNDSAIKLLRNNND